jgi:hypothetical protein
MSTSEIMERNEERGDREVIFVQKTFNFEIKKLCVLKSNV